MRHRQNSRQYPRTARVNELLREILADNLERIDDDRLQLMTLTGIDCDRWAEEKARGVIAASAGNHAQGLAYHGARLGIPVTIVMPRTTPNVKVSQTEGHGASVILHGENVDESLAYARQLSSERGLTIVHPFRAPIPEMTTTRATMLPSQLPPAMASAAVGLGACSSPSTLNTYLRPSGAFTKKPGVAPVSTD